MNIMINCKSNKCAWRRHHAYSCNCLDCISAYKVHVNIKINNTINTIIQPNKEKFEYFLILLSNDTTTYSYNDLNCIVYVKYHVNMLQMENILSRFLYVVM